MAFLDALGQRLGVREKMAQDLGGLEDSILTRAMDELTQRKVDRGGRMGHPQMGIGADAYQRKMDDEGDAAFLRSFLETGERPRVRVGYAQDENVYGAPPSRLSAPAGVVPTPIGQVQDHEARLLQEILMNQRLKQQGFGF